MSGPDTKVPLDRRASLRTSMRLSVAPGEDDEYDLQAMGISDGFRPTDVRENHVPNLLTTSYLAPAPSELHPIESQLQLPPQRPSSIAKPPNAHDSFSLRHDGGMGPDAESATAATGSSSSAVEVPLARTESVYQGPTAPSFPYQMYPQDVRLARSPSVATTATGTGAEMSYQGPNNPTHPYQMYPQNTVSESEAGDGRNSPEPAPVPVGFPGATDQYQRRLGPEGEEIADMIGPDGHTEQLPPYTRFPDEAYQRKIAGIGLAIDGSASASASGSAAASASTSSPLQVRDIPGAGGIGLATRNPEFGSAEDLRLAGASSVAASGATSPQSRQSLRSFHSEASHHEINTAAAHELNEKKDLKKWQVVAKRKVWGVVPCWALAITIVIVVMLAVVLGTVLGIFFNKPKKPDHGSGSSSSMMSYDTQSLSSVPAGLPALVTGHYALPLSLKQSSALCFNDTNQAQAWNCNQVFAQLTLTVDALTGQPATSQYSATIDYNTSFTLESNSYSYGTQPPKVNGVQMQLVNDLNEPSRGAAWAFEVTYNKTVVIPESLFSAPSVTGSSNVVSYNKARQPRRQGGPPPPGFPGGGDFHRKGLAQDGDKPWVCYWDATILEFFIYPAQNNTQPPPPPFGFSGNNSFPFPFPSSTSASSSTSTTAASSSPAITSAVAVTSTGTTAGSVDTSSSQSILPKYQYNFVTRRGEQAEVSSESTSNAPTTTGTTTTGTLTGTATATSSGFFDTSMPDPDDFLIPFFPLVVKMAERRVTQNPPVEPYCQQFEIVGDGVPAKPILDSSGKIIEVQISENEGNGSDGSRKSKFVHKRVIDEYLESLQARDSDTSMSNCGCMWWLT